jgi:hypothetical protein
VEHQIVLSPVPTVNHFPMLALVVDRLVLVVNGQMRPVPAEVGFKGAVEQPLHRLALRMFVMLVLHRVVQVLVLINKQLSVAFVLFVCSKREEVVAGNSVILI